MLADAIMTSRVVTADPDEEVAVVARRLLDNRISALPVVRHDGRLCGIVSEGDLMRRAECGRSRSWWLSLMADETADFRKTLGTRVRDVMTHDVVTVDEETPIAEIAHILEAKGIKRVPVLRGGRLVGIVSRADVLRALAAIGDRDDVSPSDDDGQIRARILALLEQRTTAALHAVSVIVVNGSVYLWGTAETQADKDAIRIAAENIAGVAKVHDFLTTLPEVLQSI